MGKNMRGSKSPKNFLSSKRPPQYFPAFMPMLKTPPPRGGSVKRPNDIFWPRKVKNLRCNRSQGNTTFKILKEISSN